MITYAALRGQWPIYLWLFGLPLALWIAYLMMTGESSSGQYHPGARLLGTIGVVAILSDYLLGFLALYARNFYSVSKRVRFTVIGYLVVAGPAMLWGFADKIHPSTWTGPDPLFARGYLRHIDGLDLKTVEIDRAYYVPNSAKTINTAETYHEAQKKDGENQSSASEMASFKATLVEAKGLSARLGPDKVSITIDGIDTDYDHILLSVKGTMSVRGSNRISDIAPDVHHDDFRFSVLDFTALPDNNSYILPFQSRGLGFGDDELFENEGSDLNAPAADTFAFFIKRVGIR